MNYVSELKRDQILLEALDEYVDKESEVIFNHLVNLQNKLL